MSERPGGGYPAEISEVPAGSSASGGVKRVWPERPGSAASVREAGNPPSSERTSGVAGAESGKR